MDNKQHIVYTGLIGIATLYLIFILNHQVDLENLVNELIAELVAIILALIAFWVLKHYSNDS